MLLFWLPPCALLLGSFVFDWWAWSLGVARPDRLSAVLAWSSYVAWVLAWLLLFGQLVLYAAVLNVVLHERGQMTEGPGAEVTTIRPAV